MFKNVGYGRESEVVFLMVTPRVLTTPDAEARLLHGASRTAGRAAEVLAAYHRACAEGRSAEAKQLALQALALDPMCFRTGTAGR
jgi:hypothetical protein